MKAFLPLHDLTDIQQLFVKHYHFKQLEMLTPVDTAWSKLLEMTNVDNME